MKYYYLVSTQRKDVAADTYFCTLAVYGSSKELLFNNHDFYMGVDEISRDNALALLRTEMSCQAIQDLDAQERWCITINTWHMSEDF